MLSFGDVSVRPILIAAGTTTRIVTTMTMNYFIFKPPITMVPDSTVDRLYMESHEFISGVKIDPIMRMSTFVNRLVESSFKLIALLAE